MWTCAAFIGASNPEWLHINEGSAEWLKPHLHNHAFGVEEKKWVIYYRVVVGENWLADERVKASIREWDLGSCHMMLMPWDFELRILLHSAYFDPPCDLKRNQKKKKAFIPLLCTRLWRAAEPRVRLEVSLVRPCALSKKGQLDSARGSAHCHDAFSTSNRRESAARR